MSELQELKATAAKLQQQIEALEKPKQWEPRGGYHAVLSSGFYIPLAVITAEQRKFGVVRQTKEAAEKASAAIRTHNRLLAFVDEFDGGWVADWTDSYPYNYCVYYTHYRNIWSAKLFSTTCIGGAVYMSKDCALGLVAKLNSGEVLL
mgnify:CR=1 FL=1